MGEDFYEWLSDPIQGRTDLFNYKMAYFLKRNWHSLSHTVAHHGGHIWDELKKVGYGFKLLNQDAKFYIRLLKRRFGVKFDQ